MADNFLSMLGLDLDSAMPSWLRQNPQSAFPVRSGIADFDMTAPLPNVMQNLAGAPNVPNPVQPQQMPEPAAAPPRERRSLLDTVGRISDVLARVGGADPLYQPTLDARADRAREIDLEGLRRTLVQQQISAGTDEAAGRQNTLVGRAVRGLQAIRAAGGDIAAAWPQLAAQAGIPQERAAALGEIFGSNPQALNAVASMLGNQEQEFGMQPFYAQDENGNLAAYQLGRDGTVRPIQLAEGQTPIDPLRFVDTGGSMVGVGTRSGETRRILPRTERPGAVADRNLRRDIANQTSADRRYAVDNRPAGRGAASGNRANSGAMVQAAQGNLAELRSIYDNLYRMGAMVQPGQGRIANATARARASGIGQMIEGTVGTEAQTLRDRVESIRPALMQSLAQATGMTGRQLDSNADVRLFMQTVTDPTRSYEANIRAIEGLERFLAANTRQPEAAPAPSTPRRQQPTRRITPRTPRGGNSGGGWGRATVVGQ